MLIATSLAGISTSTGSAHNGIMHKAEIRFGSCESLSQGPIFVLNPLSPQAPPTQGDAGESSETVITYPAANLLDANLSVVVTGTAGSPNTVIACGAITEERLLATQGLGGLRVRLDEVGGSGHDGMVIIDAEGQDRLYVGVSVMSLAGSAGSATTTRTAVACRLVELYPGYPGYQGYVTGLDGVGDHACLNDLEDQNAFFSRRDEDSANLAAGRRLGLEGSVNTWTWENWLAVEAERGMTPTCYACALANANARPEPSGTPVQYDDPRLLLGRIGEWTVLNRYTAERGLNYGDVPGLADYQIRAIIGLANPGRHLNATQLLAKYDSSLDLLLAPGGFIDPAPLMTTLYDQGGYFPVPENAAPDDQVFAMMTGAYGLEAGLAFLFFPQFIDLTDRLVTGWLAEGADGTLTDYFCAEGKEEAC